MIDKQSNKPSGFGRKLYSHGELFEDASYKDGKKNGIER
jgi:antitoxin component YwqK of YwqJK toxin-antitoxin module